MNRPWIFILLVLALVIYFWVPMLLMVLEVKPEPEPDLVTATEMPAVTRRSLDEDNMIAQRNLFGSPQQKGSVPSEEQEGILLEAIPTAKKNLGLTLVGTVLTDDPNTSIAFIRSRSTRHHEPYLTGDRIGEVLVKRILRHKVVIETERGEELLVMSFEGDSAGSLRSSGSSSEDSSSSSPTDLEPTVSSGPLYGGSSSSVGSATRDDGNAVAESTGSTSGRGTAATDSGGSLRSFGSSSEDSSSSSLTDPEPSVSSGPLW